MFGLRMLQTSNLPWDITLSVPDIPEDLQESPSNSLNTNMQGVRSLVSLLVLLSLSVWGWQCWSCQGHPKITWLLSRVLANKRGGMVQHDDVVMDRQEWSSIGPHWYKENLNITASLAPPSVCLSIHKDFGSRAQKVLPCQPEAAAHKCLIH